jgi:hypothetical protein
LVDQYVDGELSGAGRLRVSRHLETCPSCAKHVEAIAGMGEMLRRAVADEPPPSRMEGLVSGVVTRVRAESAVSWAARLERAVADSRLLWVGTGSVLGATATMMLVAFALFFGQAGTFAADISIPAGTLLAVAGPGDGHGDGLLVQFDSRAGTRVITEAMLSEPSEYELVEDLAKLMTRKGRLVELSDMAPGDRMKTENLLDAIIRRQTKEVVQIQLQQVRLITTADVSAKGL